MREEIRDKGRLILNTINYDVPKLKPWIEKYYKELEEQSETL